MNWAIRSVLLLSIVVVGCDSKLPPPPATPPTLEQALLSCELYGKLPGLRASNHSELLEELEQIEIERGTPELLQSTPPPDNENIAAAMVDLFPADRLERLTSESEALFPGHPFLFAPDELHRAITLRQGHESHRKTIEMALARPKCDFKLRHLVGYSADLTWIDVVRIDGRLEAFLAAEQLQLGKLTLAIESWERMLRLASCLAAEKRISARLEAAYLRAEALAVLAALVNAPDTTNEDLDRMGSRMQQHLRDWAKDDGAWIGDRALGLYTYEMARDGRLLEVLTDEELQQLDDEGFMKDMPQRLRRTIDTDELYYLTTMRKIIASCEHPYFQRVGLFEQIGQELQSQLKSRGDSCDFPLIAGRLLLPDVRRGHEIQARDRAHCEAWAIALASAAGNKRPPYQINPLSGKTYQIRELTDRIFVSNVGSGEPGDEPSITVPRPEQEP